MIRPGMPGTSARPMCPSMISTAEMYMVRSEPISRSEIQPPMMQNT